MGSSVLIYSMGALLLFTSVIMILLVLIQRGRGGGLAGAFGGQGGQSALGVRTGDVFTKITVVVAVIWVLLAGILGISMRAKAEAETTGTTMTLAEDEKTEDELGDAEEPLVKKADDVEPFPVDDKGTGETEGGSGSSEATPKKAGDAASTEPEAADTGKADTGKAAAEKAVPTEDPAAEKAADGDSTPEKDDSK